MSKQNAHAAKPRSGKFQKPEYWRNDPLPSPAPASDPAKTDQDSADPAGLSPTRYGDWVKDGIAVDF